MSGTSVVVLSTGITRSPQQDIPGRPVLARRPATCSNSVRTGSAPSCPRPRDSKEISADGPAPRPPAPLAPASRPAVRHAPLAVPRVGRLGHLRRLAAKSGREYVLASRNLAADGIDFLPDFSRTSEGEGLMEGHTGQMVMREIIEDYLTT